MLRSYRNLLDLCGSPYIHGNLLGLPAILAFLEIPHFFLDILGNIFLLRFGFGLLRALLIVIFFLVFLFGVLLESELTKLVGATRVELSIVGQEELEVLSALNLVDLVGHVFLEYWLELAELCVIAEEGVLFHHRLCCLMAVELQVRGESRWHIDVHHVSLDLEPQLSILRVAHRVHFSVNRKHQSVEGSRGNLENLQIFDCNHFLGQLKVLAHCHRVA